MLFYQVLNLRLTPAHFLMLKELVKEKTEKDIS